MYVEGTEVAYIGITTTIFQSVIMVHSIMHRQTPINFCYNFDLNTNATQSHPLTLQTRSSSINAFRYSFYMNTPSVGTQSHMKFCPYHHTHIDHSSAIVCLTDAPYSMLLFCIE